MLGDGTEVTSDSHDGEMFDHEDEDKDLDSQVDKYGKGERNDREGTPGPQSAAQVTESPSSVQTEKSDNGEAQAKDLKPVASPQTSQK